MKLKLWVLVFVGVCLFLLLANQTQAVTYAELKKQLKYRLAEGSPDFSDYDLQGCIIMGRIAVLSHGLARHATLYTSALPYVVVQPNQQYIKLPSYSSQIASLDIMFVSSVIKISGGERRSLLECHLKDIGHKHLDTDVPLSFFCFFRDADSTNIYVFKASAQTETLQVQVYMCGFSEVTIRENPIFEEVWLDYALFIAYLRIENYQAAAQAYNTYVQGIAVLREEIINTQPDVTVAPKIIK